MALMDDLPPITTKVGSAAVITDFQGNVVKGTSGKQRHQGFAKGFLNSSKKDTDQQRKVGKVKSTTAVTVPEKFILKPSSPEDVLALQRQELLGKLAPDAETVHEVLDNQQLLQGFDDPDIMAAVAKIAKNPTVMQAYTDNENVMRFYTEMAQVMSRKLQRKGASEGPSQKTEVVLPS